MANIAIYRYQTVRPCDPGKMAWWGIDRGEWHQYVFAATVHPPTFDTISKHVSVYYTTIESYTGYLYGTRESFWVRILNHGSTPFSQLNVNLLVAI
jgi:hypothetical protein